MASIAITPKNFGLWFGRVWFAVGAHFLVIGLYVGVQHITINKRLDAEGNTVKGLVLTKTIASSSSGSSRSSTPTYKVTFRFVTPNGIVPSEAQVTVDVWDSLVEREPIQVTYVPDVPQYYRVEGQVSGWMLPIIFTILGGIFTSLGGFILLLARSRLQTTRRLQREGITTTATVSDIRAAKMRVNGAQQLAVHS